VRPHVVRCEDIPHVLQVLAMVLLPFEREDLADLGAAEQVLLGSPQHGEQGDASAHVLLRVCVVEERLVRERDPTAVEAQPAGAGEVLHGCLLVSEAGLGGRQFLPLAEHRCEAVAHRARLRAWLPRLCLSADDGEELVEQLEPGGDPRRVEPPALLERDEHAQVQRRGQQRAQ
jgi:hypothetical protein